MSEYILPEPSRRAFLTGACALVGLSVGAVLLADDASAAPGIKRLPDGRVQVTVSKVSALAKPGGVVALSNVKGVPTAIVRTQASKYVALDLRCPHAGVTVGLDGADWLCAAHGSQFALDGALELGPATKGLARVTSRLSNGVLTIG
jgi:Rieske Fe-S protein